jgi:hypothetical protein
MTSPANLPYSPTIFGSGTKPSAPSEPVASEFGEVLATVNRIISGDADSWYNEWNATPERVLPKPKLS